MKNNFDQVAPVYDTLKRLVFGQSICRAERAHLHLITDGDKVLLLGGGTGQVIEDIYAAYSKVELTYIEASAKMMRKAMSRHASVANGTYINFVQLPFEQFSKEEKYDVVIAHFFLDVFTEANLVKATRRIGRHLSPKGVLLVTDFEYGTSWYMKIWQAPLLWCMHFFFKMASNLESDALQDIHNTLQKNGFKQRLKQSFRGGFIFSRVYTLREQVGDLKQEANA